MKKSQLCFDREAADQFLRQLLEDVFPNGKVEKAKEFYTPDFVGHFAGVAGEEAFYFDDICDRITAIKKHTKKCYFEVKNFFIIDDLLVFRVKQSWVTKAGDLFNNLTLLGVYRIQNKKICEAWLSYDNEEITPYKETNKNFAEKMLQFELSRKTKQDFLQQLKAAQKLYDVNVKLSAVEKDCLYYYFHGFSAKETALKMDLSFRTIETYLAQVKDKFACKTKAELRKKLFTDSVRSL